MFMDTGLESQKILTAGGRQPTTLLTTEPDSFLKGDLMERLCVSHTTATDEVSASSDVLSGLLLTRGFG